MPLSTQRIPEGFEIYIPPHGYVRFVDVLGTDQRIVEAARISYKSPSKGEEADRKLLHYLFKNRHTSPFEQCSITFNIKFPIFLMRQFVRHRTFRLNEWSGRYSELKDDFFLPQRWREQDRRNKQGSIEVEEWENFSRFATNIASRAYEETYAAYKTLLDIGVAKELARIILPVGIYTEIYVNCDVHNLMHFFRLRIDPHAQKEMVDIAIAMYDIAKNLFPWTFEAYERYKWPLQDLDSDQS